MFERTACVFALSRNPRHEALVQLLDLRVRRNLHGRPLYILLLGSLGLGDDALDLLHGKVHIFHN